MLAQNDNTSSLTPQATSRKGGFMDQVRQIAEEVAQREGCNLYDLELVGAGANRILRVYIEKAPGLKLAESVSEWATEAQLSEPDTTIAPKGEFAGASVEDCANVSRGLNLLLDVDDVIPGGQYHLEVSTPGLERGLRLPWHFAKSIGKLVNVKAFASLSEYIPETLSSGGGLASEIAQALPNVALVSAEELGKAKQATGELLAALSSGVCVEWLSQDPKAQAKSASLSAEGDADSGADSVLRAVYIPFSAIAKANRVFRFEETVAGAFAGGQSSGNKKKAKKQR